jgi:hypothetical protein
MKKQSVVQFRAHGLFKIIIITKIIEKKGAAKEKKTTKLVVGSS